MPSTQVPQSNLGEFTVSELSFALKRTVEGAFGHVRVRGEISGYKRAASGHVYLSLKDQEAVMDAVVWRGTANRLKFAPEDGLEVICTGKVSTYPARSKYQLIIETMEPAGVGALLALLEERKRKLAAEGLFDEARKRPLPYLPEVIGVVTSPTGAVIRDILHRLGDRFPRRVLLWPVLVQGDGAAEQVAAAIKGFNSLPEEGDVPRPDVLIVARGGGSIEDLWAFNEEVVARAAAASAVPLISAVGHETDTTLIDFVSDRRAPTPTAAAEMAVPVRADLIAGILDLTRRLVRSESRLLADARATVASLARSLPKLPDLLALPQQRFDHAAERLVRGLDTNTRAHETRLVRISSQLRLRTIEDHITSALRRNGELGERLTGAARRVLTEQNRRLTGAGKLLESLSYRGVLARGYAVVRSAAGVAIPSVSATAPGMAVNIEFSDGEVGAVIGPGEAPNGPKSNTKASKKPQKTGNLPASGQGNLF